MLPACVDLDSGLLGSVFESALALRPVTGGPDTVHGVEDAAGWTGERVTDGADLAGDAASNTVDGVEDTEVSISFTSARTHSQVRTADVLAQTRTGSQTS